MKSIKPSTFPLVFIAAFLTACQSTIPPEQEKNYALIVSRISDYGADMDSSNASSSQSTAYIDSIDGSRRFGSSTVDVLPGEYSFQVGLNCNNSATCHESMPYKIIAEAGKRYVIKPYGIFVSDRFSSRTNEIPYRYPAH